MKCASFFAGVGGIDLGFKLAGFDVIYANEFDTNAQITLKENFKGLIDPRDIREVQADDIPDFDVMLGGFPCQAFSIAGNRQGFNDDKGRGNLFFEMERLFMAKQPQIIFLENVKNLATHDNGNTLKVILGSLRHHGYHVKHAILNASTHGGIPQNRERIYIVCFKDIEVCNRFEFPSATPLTLNIKDMLEDEARIDSKFYYTNKTPIYPHLVNAIKDAETVYQWRRKYVRANKSQLCPTLTANMGTGGHNVPLVNPQCKPTTIRKLTPRECFNFQGYPFDFKLPSHISNSHLYKQAGNSVVVTVIQRIANQIKRAINASS